MQDKLIVCAGMRRSGSVWSYYVVRSILDMFSVYYENWGFVTWQEMEAHLADWNAPVAVLKSHVFLPEHVPLQRFIDEGKLYPLYIYRPLCQATASVLRMRKKNKFSQKELLHEVSVMVCNGQAWEAISQRLSVSFSAMEHNPEKVVRQIGEWLGFELSQDELGKIVQACSKDELRKLQPITERYDEDTLLWSDHISETPYPKLSEDCCRAIQVRFHSWVQVHG